MERNTVKDRLIAYLSEKKLSKAEFGRRIGASSAFVTSMRKSMLRSRPTWARGLKRDKDVDAQFERLDGLF